MNKIFALCFVLICTIHLLAYDAYVDGIYYNLNSTDLTAEVTISPIIRHYKDTIVIPSSFSYENNTYSVTTIGEKAFYNCIGLTSVTIGNSVTTIGDNAFMYCSGLTSVTIGNSVTTIGEYAFSDCSGLTSVTIPNSVTTIGKGAFYKCSGLTSVTIPNSVTTIGKGAFYKCSGLTSVTIGNSVTTIGSQAFEGCSNLTSITWNAANCESLSSNLFDSPFAGIASQITSFNFGSEVETIPAYLCYGMSGLMSVTIPSSVTTIGEWAFYDVLNLVYSGTAIGSPWGAKCVNGYIDGYWVYSDVTKTEICGCSSAATGTITIPNSVTTIGNSAFCDCSSLTSIEIPNSVTTIGEWAFSWCSGLKSITIPASVTSIGACPFARCDSLTSINVDFNNTHYKSTDGVLFNYAQDTLIQYPADNVGTEYVIPNTVTTIAMDAFCLCKNLTSVTIPASVTSIEPAAFAYCSKLTTITFADNSQLTTIGDQSFWYCKLTSITIPNSVTTIGNKAFWNCAFTSITLGSSVTLIGDSAFYKCSRLKTIFNGSELNIAKGSTMNGYVAYYADTVYNWVQVGDFRIRQDTLVKYVGQESNVSIPNEITIIADSAFANCSTLTSVVIPNSVETIGESAFANCIYLTDVVLGANVQEIGCNAFAGDFRLENITCYAPVTPNVCNTTFSGINKPYVYLYVPTDYQRKYQVDPNWSGFSLHLIGAEQKPIEGDNVTVLPSTDNATFTWPANPSADGYSLEITKDGVVFCTLKFNAQGQLTGIAFAPGRDGAREMASATMTANGWQFTVTGLNEGSKYGYTLDALNASQQSIKHYEGEFTTDGYTGLDELTIDNAQCTVRKFIRNNQLHIFRNGKMYNALGGEGTY